jgi:hypothetical protein
MLKKDITYTDIFDGVQRTETVHFNLTKAELVEFIAQFPQDFKAYIQEITFDSDRTRFVMFFKKLIMAAYGKRQGSDFVKTPEMAEQFTHTEQYSELLMELFSSEAKLIAFFNGVLGVDIMALAAEAQAKQQA